MIEVTYAPGTFFDSHVHEESYLCLVTRGVYDEWPGAGGRRTLGAGRDVLYREGSEHAVRTGATEVRMLHVTDPSGASWAGTPGPRTVGHLWQLTAALSELGRTASDTASRLHLESIVEELSPAPDPSSDSPWLAGVRERLRFAFREPLSLVTLARQADRHPAHLARAFRARWGMTAGEFLRRVRVAEAVRMLRESEKPIAFVAIEAGFSDQSHLGRWMKRYLGATPEQVRQGRADLLT